MSISRLETPQVHGSGRGELGVGKGGVMDGKVLASGTVDDNELQTSTPTRNFYLAAYGITPNIDLTWSHSQYSSGFFGLKFQVFGAPKASPGGQALSLKIAIAGNDHETNGDTKLEFNLAATDYSIHYGMYLMSYLQLYNSLSYTSYKFHGEVKSDTASLNGQNFHYASKQINYTIGLSFYYSGFEALTEANFYRFQIESTPDESGMAIGAALKYHF